MKTLLYNLCELGFYTDLSLTINCKPYNLHKHLVTKSMFFKTLVDNMDNMSTTEEIEILDVDGELIKVGYLDKVIRWLYDEDDNIVTPVNDIKELLRYYFLADFLQIDELKKIIVGKINDILDKPIDSSCHKIEKGDTDNIYLYRGQKYDIQLDTKYVAIMKIIYDAIIQIKNVANCLKKNDNVEEECEEKKCEISKARTIERGANTKTKPIKNDIVSDSDEEEEMADEDEEEQWEEDEEDCEPEPSTIAVSDSESGEEECEEPKPKPEPKPKQKLYSYEKSRETIIHEKYMGYIFNTNRHSFIDPPDLLHDKRKNIKIMYKKYLEVVNRDTHIYYIPGNNKLNIAHVVFLAEIIDDRHKSKLIQLLEVDEWTDGKETIMWNKISEIENMCTECGLRKEFFDKLESFIYLFNFSLL